MNATLRKLTLVGIAVSSLALATLTQAATVTLSGATGNTCTYTSISPGTGAGDLVVSCATTAPVCSLSVSPMTVAANTATTFNLSNSNCATGSYSVAINGSTATAITGASYQINANNPANTTFTFSYANAAPVTITLSGSTNPTPTPTTGVPTGCSISPASPQITGGSTIVLTATCTGGSAVDTYTWNHGANLAIVSGQGTSQLTLKGVNNGTSNVSSAVSMVATNSFGNNPGPVLHVYPVITPAPVTPIPGPSVCTNATPTNVDIRDMTVFYNEPNRAFDTFIGANRIFAGQFTYYPNANLRDTFKILLEEGNQSNYSLQRKEVSVSECRGSLFQSESAGNNCYRTNVDIDSLQISNAANPVSYKCNLVAGKTYFINIRTLNGLSSSLLTGMFN